LRENNIFEAMFW